MLLSEHLLCIYYHLASIFKKNHPTYLLFCLLKITYHIFCCNIMLYGCAVQGVPERYILFLEKINLFGSQYMCFSTAFGLARSGVHNVSSENYSIYSSPERCTAYILKCLSMLCRLPRSFFVPWKKRNRRSISNFYNFTFYNNVAPSLSLALWQTPKVVYSQLLLTTNHSPILASEVKL